MSGSIDILGLPYEALRREFEILRGKSGKGAFHAEAAFRSAHRNGVFEPDNMRDFADNPSLARRAAERFHCALPSLSKKRGEGETYKFLLRLPDGLESESVVIPMRKYKTLCVSSQVGCKMGCRFCETARMGFVRQLTAGEITAQVLTARLSLNEPVENVVFMGMGEPLDNFDAVTDSIRILTDPRGLSLPRKNITVSTVGHVPALSRLAGLVGRPPPEGLGRLRLAVSLNAPNDGIRAAIMPVNGLWPLSELKAALLRWPLRHADDFIFAEYVLLAGVNDAIEHARELAEYLRGLRSCVNLIPYNPGSGGIYGRPPPERVAAFFRTLRDAGQPCRIRGVKGDGAMAACGQLGNLSLSHRAPVLETA
jgi:23S rRNA (adenine2503-C2)-methyltransferase